MIFAIIYFDLLRIDSAAFKAFACSLVRMGAGAGAKYVNQFAEKIMVVSSLHLN